MRTKALVWILRPGPQVLLLRRPERRGGGEHPVTGKAEKGETPAECAEREAFEETELRGRLVDLKFRHRYEGKSKRYEEHAFALIVPQAAEPVLSSEHDGARWVSPKEAFAALAWPAHREALQLALDAS
jgi:8-oxo-dGTP pyrophosphatase MutT (NUDIX family)